MKSKLLKCLLAASMTASAFGMTYAAQPAEVHQAQAAAKTMYSQVDGLNIRASASTKGKIVGKFNTNDKIKVLKTYNKSWYQISYKGYKRYVNKKYVSKDVYYIMWGYVSTPNNMNLNIRSGPSTKYKIVTKAKSSAYVKVTDFYNFNWYKVYHNGKFGYVSADYIMLWIYN